MTKLKRVWRLFVLTILLGSTYMILDIGHPHARMEACTNCANNDAQCEWGAWETYQACMSADWTDKTECELTYDGARTICNSQAFSCFATCTGDGGTPPGGGGNDRTRSPGRIMCDSLRSNCESGSPDAYVQECVTNTECPPPDQGGSICAQSALDNCCTAEWEDCVANNS